jgi:hypothetical protein
MSIPAPIAGKLSSFDKVGHKALYWQDVMILKKEKRWHEIHLLNFMPSIIIWPEDEECVPYVVSPLA